MALQGRDAEVVVVGGGIVGLAAARAALAAGLAPVVVLEKEDRLARHQTGRNSGVLHTGLYYAPGSAKARLAVAGHRRMREYCQARGVPLTEVGKLVVAVDGEEVARLRGLLTRGRANGVADLAWVEGEELRRLEPAVAAKAALFSPHTAALDFAAVARALAEEIAAAGGLVRLGAAVDRLVEEAGGVRAILRRGEVRARLAVVAAGLQSDRLARRSGGALLPAIVPFTGMYYQLADALARRLRHHVYPVPDPALPFLGVHVTRHPDGTVTAGPSAFLAFGREAYGARDVNLVDLLEVARFPGFWRFARRHWRQGLAEAQTRLFRRAFAARLARYLPEVRAEHLTPLPPGVRAQAMDADGTLIDDFVLEEGRRTVFVRNAPSPAATAALAIGEEVVRRLRALSALNG